MILSFLVFHMCIQTHKIIIFFKIITPSQEAGYYPKGIW